MKLVQQWKKYMGPKDERIEAESNKVMRVGYTIFLFGGALVLYYGIMLGQVASTTDTPIFTPVGEQVFSVTNAFLVLYLIGAFVPSYMLMRAGISGERRRYAQVDRVPWDYVVLVALLIAVIIGALTVGMRILAEIQIVGIDHVAWFGDLAIGVVFAVIGFVIGLAAISADIKGAINARRKLENELDYEDE